MSACNSGVQLSHSCTRSQGDPSVDVISRYHVMCRACYGRLCARHSFLPAYRYCIAVRQASTWSACMGASA